MQLLLITLFLTCHHLIAAVPPVTLRVVALPPVAVVPQEEALHRAGDQAGFKMFM